MVVGFFEVFGGVAEDDAGDVGEVVPGGGDGVQGFGL
jgi:hypothetical protein